MYKKHFFSVIWLFCEYKTTVQKAIFVKCRRLYKKTILFSVTRLYKMYNEPEPLPLPDTESNQSIEALGTCVLLSLLFTMWSS